MFGYQKLREPFTEIHPSLYEPKSDHFDMTLLHYACIASSTENVSLLLKQGFSVNIGNNESPLNIALKHGNIPVARLLLEMGADIKRLNFQNYTPMASAIMSPIKLNINTVCSSIKDYAVAAVKLLVEYGVSVNDDIIPSEKMKPIHFAVHLNLPKVVSLLLKMNADPNILTLSGWSALHMAVVRSHTDIIKLLVEHNVDLYKENNYGQTASELAILHRALSSIKTLAECGYDLNKLSSNSCFSALHLACFMCYTEEVVLLVKLGAHVNSTLGIPPLSPFHYLAIGSDEKEYSEKENTKKRKEIAEFLFNNGGDLNIRNCKFIVSPLEVALKSGFFELAEMFVEMGANFNIRLTSGETLFHDVVKLNNKIIILLLDFGADYNVYNKQNNTAYHTAIIYKVDLKYIKYFLKRGCPYNQKLQNLSIWKNVLKKCNSETKKLFAAQRKFLQGIVENNLQLVKLAIAEGAVPTSRSEDFKYPLHFVASKGYKGLLKYLLEIKNPPNTLNDKDETVLYLAAKYGCYHSCCLLLQYGACFNYRSKKCPKSPIEIAREYKHNCIVSLLHNVGMMFHFARSNKSAHILLTAMKSLSDVSVPYYLVFSNAIDIKGYTVIQTALDHNNFEIVHAMMELRTVTSCDLTM